MNLIHKSVAVFGLAAIAFGAVATIPANAQAPAPVIHHQVRHAAALDRRASQAAFTGHYRKAAKLRQRANHIRQAAVHGA